MNGDIRVQTRGGLPGAITDTGNELTGFSRGVKGHRAAIAKHGEAGRDHPRHLYLQSLNGRIHTARGASAGGFLAQDIPGFQSMAQFQLDAAHGHRADGRKAKLEVGSEPLAEEAISGAGEVAHYILPIKLHKVRQHEAVVQAGSPEDQFLLVRLAPKMGDQRPHQQLLGQAHAGMGRHFKGAQLEQAESRSSAFWRIEFVDAKFRAMGATGYVGQQMPEQAIGHPRCHWALARPGS